MTKQEWLECADPDQMLSHLGRRVSNRKLRLFGCACYRHVPNLMVNEDIGNAIEISERYADQCASKQELCQALSKAFSQVRSLGLRPAFPTPKCVLSARRQTALTSKDGSAERKYQVSILHDVFDFLTYRPCLHASWLTWNDATVPQIAQAIYNDRAFDRMPILADALEDAGCDNVDILNHCRSEGLHVKGCWVVDLLLGKE